MPNITGAGQVYDANTKVKQRVHVATYLRLELLEGRFEPAGRK